MRPSTQSKYCERRDNELISYLTLVSQCERVVWANISDRFKERIVTRLVPLPASSSQVSFASPFITV